MEDACKCVSKDATRAWRHFQTVHLKVRLWRCKHCTQSFELQGGLVAHIVEKHKGQKIAANLKCKLYRKVLASPRTLRIHEEKCQFGATLRCQYSNCRHKPFGDLVAWASHMYIVHEAGKKLKCLGCEGEYSAPGSMQDHWRKTGHPYDKVGTNNFKTAMRKRAKETLEQIQAQNPAPPAAAEAAAAALGHPPVPGDNEDEG